MNYSLTQLNRNSCHIVFNKEHFLFFPESLKLVKTDADTIDSVSRRTDLNSPALTETGNKDASENELDKKLNQFCTINGKEKYEHDYYNSSSLQYLNLNLTHQCNLKCSYCYAGYGEYLNKSGNKKMNLDVAIKAVDLFFNNVKKDKQKLFIDFFGGEPLLNIPVLKKVVTYIK